MISAACHQVIRLAIARKITSCTFIARSIAVFEAGTGTVSREVFRSERAAFSREAAGGAPG
jgi:hypothetical protein